MNSAALLWLLVVDDYIPRGSWGYPTKLTKNYRVYKATNQNPAGQKAQPF
jgi:hypothetical protein